MRQIEGVAFSAEGLLFNSSKPTDWLGDFNHAYSIRSGSNSKGNCSRFRFLRFFEIRSMTVLKVIKAGSEVANYQNFLFFYFPVLPNRLSFPVNFFFHADSARGIQRATWRAQTQGITINGNSHFHCWISENAWPGWPPFGHSCLCSRVSTRREGFPPSRRLETRCGGSGLSCCCKKTFCERSYKIPIFGNGTAPPIPLPVTTPSNPLFLSTHVERFSTRAVWW